MKNLVKINYNGIDFIGQIKDIRSVWDSGVNISTGETFYSLIYYSVALIECNSGATVSNIIIRDVSQIKILNEDGVINE